MAISEVADKTYSLIEGTKWAGPITYSFPINPNGYVTYGDKDGANYADPSTSLKKSFETLTQAQREAAHFFLDGHGWNDASNGFSIAGFTNLNITFVNHSEVARNAAIVRFAQGDLNPDVAGRGKFPSDAAIGGDVWLDKNSFTAMRPGERDWKGMAHELGHVMGLQHENPKNSFYDAKYDRLEYTVESGLTSNGIENDNPNNSQQTFMIRDIQAMQELYGANFNVNSGNTVYKWTPNSGRTYVNGDVAIDPATDLIFMSVWDGGARIPMISRHIQQI